MKFEEFANKLNLSINEDYSENTANKIIKRLNNATIKENKLTISQKEEILELMMVNESDNSAHLDFIKTIKSMIKKEK